MSEIASRANCTNRSSISRRHVRKRQLGPSPTNAGESCRLAESTASATGAAPFLAAEPRLNAKRRWYAGDLTARHADQKGEKRNGRSETVDRHKEPVGFQMLRQDEVSPRLTFLPFPGFVPLKRECERDLNAEESWKTRETRYFSSATNPRLECSTT